MIRSCFNCAWVQHWINFVDFHPRKKRKLEHHENYDAYGIHFWAKLFYKSYKIYLIFQMLLTICANVCIVRDVQYSITGFYRENYISRIAILELFAVFNFTMRSISSHTYIITIASAFA